MKVKVSEATGPVLDWMVAKAKEISVDLRLSCLVNGPRAAPFVNQRWVGDQERWDRYEPSTNWTYGGPIIEREGIDLWCNVPSGIAEKHKWWGPSWRACYHRCGVGTEPSYGPAPLIAAMRCYVTSKLGDEVDVLKELA